MNRPKNRNGGFTLALALMAILLVAIAGVMLGEACSTISLRSRTMRLQYENLNLAASAAAWADQARSRDETITASRRLDISKLAAPDEEMQLTVQPGDDGRLNISAACRNGRIGVRQAYHAVSR